MVKTISSCSSSRVLEQVDDRGKREGKGVHTIRDSCYHKEKGAEKMLGGGGWQHTRQTLEKSPTSKLYTTSAHILSDRNVFAPRGGGGKRRGPMPLGLFLFFFGGGWSLAPDLRSVKTILAGNFRSFRVYSPEFS